MDGWGIDLAALPALLSSVSLAVALAACAGIRAWLPLFLAGLLARGGQLELGPDFQFMASDRALALFGLATVLELAADKIPALDHALDALSTPLRPAAGALLAASALWQVSDPLTALALGTAVGAPTALVPHAAKSALRAASSALTAGLANPVISLLEDVLAIALFVLAVLVPLAVLLALAALALMVARRRSRRLQPAAPAA
jgi:hypothetical protein